MKWPLAILRPRIGRFTLGRRKTKVSLHYVCVFGLLVIAITGGKAHIGALGLQHKAINAIWRRRGHRDDVVIDHAFPILASLPFPTLIIAGIHQNRPSRREISAILTNSRRLCDRLTHDLNHATP